MATRKTTTAKRKARRPPDRSNWGGRREGAGRKPKGEVAGVPHRPREPISSRYPALVVLKVEKGMPSLRGKAERQLLFLVLANQCERDGFRLVHFSLQRDRFYLIVEGTDRAKVARALKGLGVAASVRLNRLWGRRGRLFTDRYEIHVLKSPKAVRDALAYLLRNEKRREMEQKGFLKAPASSGPWFDGWQQRLDLNGIESAPSPVARARSALLTTDWRRLGLIAIGETPHVTFEKLTKRNTGTVAAVAGAGRG